MDDDYREHWIHNDEGLFGWWKSTKLPMDRFIEQNRAELDERIKRATNDQTLRNILANARRY